MPKLDQGKQPLDAPPTTVGANACALAVMTKVPQAGTSKTRLVPPLAASQAATLSACFLRDTCDNIAAIGLNGTVAGVAVYTPFGAEAFFDGLLPNGFSILVQRGKSFGERLLHASEDLFSLGYDSLCLIDSDSPTLPPVFLQGAVAALARPGDRMVLGPAEDGGYYLIGLKKAHRRVFEDVEWSTSRVLAQTIARAKEIDLPVTLLPSWFDVDDATTLRQLCDELFHRNGNQPRQPAAVAYRAPHTRDYLSRLMKTDTGQRIWRSVAEFDKAAAGGSRRCDLTIE
jgi:rSAM/selenodomain-associated transferase 1